MLTTEKQAREKWCPFTRVSLYHRSTNANRMVRYGEGTQSEDFLAFQTATNCIGSECMAWRWSRTLRELGHCGLVGKPIGDDSGLPSGAA